MGFGVIFFIQALFTLVSKTFFIIMAHEKETAAGADSIYVEAQTPVMSAQDSPTLSGQVDDDYALYKKHAEGDVDPLEAKKVLRKIDKRIVPLLFTILSAPIFG